MTLAIIAMMKFNLLKKLEEYVFEIPEMFKINIVNNAYHIVYKIYELMETDFYNRFLKVIGWRE